MPKIIAQPVVDDVAHWLAMQHDGVRPATLVVYVEG